MNDSFMRAPGVHILLPLAIAGVLLSGCRTYGGHGSEEATYQQIQKAHQIFQEDLARKQADLSRLEQAAGESEVLGMLAMQYGQIVRGHEAVVAAHTDQIAELSADSDYRHLHRVFGAVVSQHNTIRIQYDGLLTGISQAQAPQDSTVRVKRPYALIPPYYTRVEQRQRELTVNEVIARLRSGSAPGFQVTTPSSSSDTGAGSSDAVGGESDAGGEASDTGGAESDPSGAESDAGGEESDAGDVEPESAR